MDSNAQVKKEPQEAADADSPKIQQKENCNLEEATLISQGVKRDQQGNPKINTEVLLPSLPLQTNLFFELFYEGPYDLTLSNRSWGIHRVPPPNRAIVLSEISYALFNVKNVSPSYKKQVILTDHLKFKAFVLDKLVVEKTLDNENTQEDFEESFAEIVSMAVCKGGPFIEDSQDMLLRCAYKDFFSNRWRHKSCTIMIEKKEVCRACSYLDKYFQEWLKYISKDK